MAAHSFIQTALHHNHLHIHRQAVQKSKCGGPQNVCSLEMCCVLAGGPFFSGLKKKKSSKTKSLGHTQLLPLTYSVLCCSLQHIPSVNTALCSHCPPQSVWQLVCVSVSKCVCARGEREKGRWVACLCVCVCVCMSVYVYVFVCIWGVPCGESYKES